MYSPRPVPNKETGTLMTKEGRETTLVWLDLQLVNKFRVLRERVRENEREPRSLCDKEVGPCGR